MELISIVRRAGVPMNNNKAREHTTPHAHNPRQIVTRDINFRLSLVYANPAGASVFACSPRNAFFALVTRSAARWLRLFYYNLFFRRPAKTVRSMRPPVSPDVIPLTLTGPFRPARELSAQGPRAFSVVVHRRPSSWVHGFRQMRAER